MIAYIFAAVLVILGLVCVWFGLAMLAGFAKGIYDMLAYVWHRRHGQPTGPAPWDLPPAPVVNTVAVPFEVRAMVWARDGGECVYCGATQDMTVDHIIPRALGGSNDPENLVSACRSCNSSKGTRDAPHQRTAAHVTMMLDRTLGRTWRPS